MKKEKTDYLENASQLDLYPESLEKAIKNYSPESSIDKKVAEKIRGFWPKFYETILVNYTNDYHYLDPEDFKNQDFDGRYDYWFNYSFSKEGKLSLVFSFPSILDWTMDFELDSAGFDAVKKDILKSFIPSKNEAGNITSHLTNFLNWNIERYDNLEFPYDKTSRIKSLLKPYSYKNRIDLEDINILLTNSWEVTLLEDVVDEDGVRESQIQMEASLNPLTMAYVIDHFDEEVEWCLFDIDQIKWWSRVDGEGFEYFIKNHKGKTDIELYKGKKPRSFGISGIAEVTAYGGLALLLLALSPILILIHLSQKVWRLLYKK